MDGDGGLDMVDAEEDPRDFENKRRSPYFELSVGLFECRRIYWYIFGGKNYRSIVRNVRRGRLRRIDGPRTRECDEDTRTLIGRYIEPSDWPL